MSSIISLGEKARKSLLWQGEIIYERTHIKQGEIQEKWNMQPWAQSGGRNPKDRAKFVLCWGGRAGRLSLGLMKAELQADKIMKGKKILDNI